MINQAATEIVHIVGELSSLAAQSPVARDQASAAVARPDDAISVGSDGAAGARVISLSDAASTFAAAAAMTAGAHALTQANVRATLQSVLADLAATREGSAAERAPAAVARGASSVAALAAASTAADVLAALPAVVADALRAVLSAPSPAEAATALAALRTAVGEASNAAAAAGLAPAASATAAPGALIAVPLVGVAAAADVPPGADGEADAENHSARAAREGDVRIPDRDARGKRYDERRRRRLRALGGDPRRGFAPEAQIALAAEEQHGLQLARSPNADHDFVDAGGGVWDALAPRDTASLEVSVAAHAADAGVLLSLGSLDPSERAAAPPAVARLLMRTGLRPIAVVDAEGAWPG